MTVPVPKHKCMHSQLNHHLNNTILTKFKQKQNSVTKVHNWSHDNADYESDS